MLRIVAFACCCLLFAPAEQACAADELDEVLNYLVDARLQERKEAKEKEEKQRAARSVTEKKQQAAELQEALIPAGDRRKPKKRFVPL